MEKSAIEKLLTGRRKRWIAVVWGLIVVASAVLPYVDRSIALYRELGELRAKMASKAELPVRARALADHLAGMRTDLDALETALVPSDRLSAFKQDVAVMARDSRCRLRSIGAGSVSSRPLGEVLGKIPPGSKGARRKSTWQVVERASSVSIQGTFASLMKFFVALRDDERILEPASIQIRPSSDSEDELILDLSIKTFDLTSHGAG